MDRSEPKDRNVGDKPALAYLVGRLNSREQGGNGGGTSGAKKQIVWEASLASGNATAMKNLWEKKRDKQAHHDIQVTGLNRSLKIFR